MELFTYGLQDDGRYEGRLNIPLLKVFYLKGVNFSNWSNCVDAYSLKSLLGGWSLIFHKISSPFSSFKHLALSWNPSQNLVEDVLTISPERQFTTWKSSPLEANASSLTFQIDLSTLVPLKSTGCPYSFHDETACSCYHLLDFWSCSSLKLSFKNCVWLFCGFCWLEN